MMSRSAWGVFLLVAGGVLQCGLAVEVIVDPTGDNEIEDMRVSMLQVQRQEQRDALEKRRASLIEELQRLGDDDDVPGHSLLQSPRQRPGERRLPRLRLDAGTPGFVVERIFHTEAVFCPWQSADEEPDSDCVRRKEYIKGMQNAIATCKRPLARNDKVLGHRGAALVAPEESYTSLRIGAESGAGYLECDVSPTSDLELVCRHSNCDLDSTTDLVTKHPDLNAKCTEPFVPGSGKKATCCTFDFTMQELGRLCGIMESGINASAATYADYLVGPPGYRSEAGGDGCHPLLSYKGYLRLLKKSGINAIPELKDTWYDRTESFFRSKGKDIYWFADEFANLLSSHGFKPAPRPGEQSEPGQVFGVMQTFDYRIAEHWKKTRPEMTVEYMWQVPPPAGANCTGGSGNGDNHGPNGPGGDCGGEQLLEHLNRLGVNMFSPPIFTLLQNGPNRTIEPSDTARMLQRLGVESIGSWSLERQGCEPKESLPYKQPVTAENNDAYIAPCWDVEAWYYSTTNGNSTWQYVDVLAVLDALFRKVGIKHMFSDFPATVATYVNCILKDEKADVRAD
eukprot:TRINITY_DN10240_c0_g2_i1.p1 TRINITY_DN10240_c0_g2~~TRINITY_DN10240_c0_g2_i1.p1  ORF type:complete len:586 (+),score=84.14 TRINITY_DN10240_c0_g2_i1:63-1760(+)